MLNKIIHRLRSIDKKEGLSIGIVVAVLVTAFLLTRLSPQVPIIFFVAIFSLLVLIIWFKAGVTIFNSFIKVSASAGVVMSVSLFIVKSYCELGPEFRTADSSAEMLWTFGLLYSIYLFAKALKETISTDLSDLKAINDGKQSVLIVLLYGLLVALFLWQFFEVVNPIVHNLCIYKPTN